MATQLSRRPLKRSPLLTRLRAKPFLYFGGPFIASVVGISFLLSHLTQTRYDHHEMNTHALTLEEELGLRKDRRHIDLREEYWRLKENQQKLREWENRRVQRLPGQGQWGDLPPENFVEPQSSTEPEQKWNAT